MKISRANFLLFVWILFLHSQFSFVNAETLTHSNTTTSQGKIVGFSENGVQFQGDKYYVFNLDKISSASVDEGVTGKEEKRQKIEIERLSRLINKERFKKERLSEILREHLQNSEFDKLDSTANKLKESKARWQSGDWLIEQYYYAFYSDLPQRDISGLTKRVQKIKEWGKERPNSTAAKVSLMSALSALGSAYRGSGVITAVSSTNLERYKSNNKEIVEVARGLIKEKKDTPMMYSYLIKAMGSLGVTSETIEKTALAAVRKEPGLGRPLENALHYLKPQWGGAFEKPAALLERAYSLFPTPANEYYYHIVVEFLPLLRDYEYHRYDFDWTKIRDGFEHYRKRVTALDRDFHRMAKLAAMHGDTKAARKYIALTDGEWNHFAIEIWRNPHELNSFNAWANQKPDPIFTQIVEAAVVKQSEAVRKLMLKYLGVRSDLGRVDIYGNTLLHIAINNNQFDLVERLIEAGARIDTPDGSGRYPIHLAASKESIEVIKLLAEAGANLSRVTRRNAQSALHLAAINGFRKGSTFLMNASPELIASSDQNGLTPLHLAASYGHQKLVEDFLANEETPLQSVDKYGNTALMAAIEQNQFDVVRSLVDGGININQKNQRNHTALSYANELGFKDIFDYIKGVGGQELNDIVTDVDIAKAKALIDEAVTYRKKADAAKSIELLEKAIALNPHDFGVYHTLAAVQWQVARDPKSAAEAIRKSLELNPNYAESYYIGGRIFHELKQPDIYKPLFQKYVRLAPNTYNAKDLKRNYSSFLKPSQVETKDNGISATIKEIFSGFF